MIRIVTVRWRWGIRTVDSVHFTPQCSTVLTHISQSEDWRSSVVQWLQWLKVASSADRHWMCNFFIDTIKPLQQQHDSSSYHNSNLYTNYKWPEWRNSVKNFKNISTVQNVIISFYTSTLITFFYMKVFVSLLKRPEPQQIIITDYFCFILEINCRNNLLKFVFIIKLGLANLIILNVLFL